MSSSLSPRASTAHPGNSSPHRRTFAMINSFSFGTGHGQDLLARQLHRVHVFRVALRLGDELVVVPRANHRSTRTLDDLGHGCPHPARRRLRGPWRNLGEVAYTVRAHTPTGGHR